jgi:hypothetical protein
MRVSHLIIATVVAFACVAPASAKTAKECEAEYQANKVAIEAAKTKKADFITQCKAGTETIPTATTAPAPATTTTPAAAAAAAPTTMTEAQAMAKCPTDTVVWVNSKNGIYHFKGTRDYGHTKAGTYMCEADAKAAGDRAAKGEKHP